MSSKQPSMTPVALVLLGLLYGAPALAAEETASELASVVVTASATEQTLATAPATVSVISREQLEKEPVRDLTEVLKKEAGLSVKRSGNRDTLVMRGLDSAYVLMMVDGRRIDSTSGVFRGNDFDTGWIPLEAIERIEVVRGPMSSLYGSDAMGGVVNIITKAVPDEWHTSLQGNATFAENRKSGDAGQGSFYTAGKLSDTVGLALYGSLAEREEDDDDINPSGIDGLDAMRDKSVGSKLSWQAAANQRVTTTLDYSDRYHDFQQLERVAGEVRHDGQWDFGDSKLSVQADQTKNKVGNVSGKVNPNKAQNLLLNGSLDLPLDTANQLLTLGGEWRYQSLDDASSFVGLPGADNDGNLGSESVTQYALFAEDAIGLREDLILTLGARLDKHEHFGSHLSPRAYLNWLLDDHWVVKGGWGQAFKAPTLLQNSPNWGSASCGSATAGCWIIGNPDLKPETSNSYELGLLADYGSWGGGITLFYNDIKDMIDITSRTKDVTQAPSYDNFVGFLPDGRPIFEYQNVASVETKGVELTGRYRIAPRWDINAAYTYLDATNKSYDYDLPLVYRPEHEANASLNWAVSERLSSFLAANYTGAQYTSVPTTGKNMVKNGGYTTFDLGGSYQVTASTKLGFGVLNFTDKTIEPTLSTDFNLEGRRYYASFNTRF